MTVVRLSQIRSLQITDPNTVYARDRVNISQNLLPICFPNLAALSLRNMTMATQTYNMPCNLSTKLLFLDLRTKGFVNNFYGFLKIRNPSTTDVLQELYKLFPNIRGLRLPLADRPTRERGVVKIFFPPPPASLEYLELHGYVDPVGVELDLWQVNMGQRLHYLSFVDIFIRLTPRPTHLIPSYGDNDNLTRKYWSLYVGGSTHQLNRRIFEAFLG